MAVLEALTPRLARLRRHGRLAPGGISATVPPSHATSSLQPLREDGRLLQLLGDRCEGTVTKPPAP